MVVLVSTRQCLECLGIDLVSSVIVRREGDEAFLGDRVKGATNAL